MAPTKWNGEIIVSSYHLQFCFKNYIFWNYGGIVKVPGMRIVHVNLNLIV